MVHGLRSDAMDRLGFGRTRRREINPSLVDVSHDAYGFTGPWSRRRGFDSLVQMSCGIADRGRQATEGEPGPSAPSAGAQSRHGVLARRSGMPRSDPRGHRASGKRVSPLALTTARS